jgi:hypothetical protein
VLARLAGSLYLIASVCFVVAIAIRSNIEGSGAGSEMIDRIRASTSLFRVSLTIDLISATLFLLTGMTLYLLLRHVDRLAAGAMVMLVAIEIVVIYLSDINLFNVLTIATSPAYIQALGAPASNALASLFVDAHANGLVIDEMFFGLWLVPLGYLVIRSRQIPWVVGALLLVAAISWIGQFLADLLAPGLPYVFEVGQVAGAGEFVFVAWLLLFGLAGARPRQTTASEI